MRNDDQANPHADDGRQLFDGRGTWLDLVRQALVALPDSAAREAVLVDDRFDAWPLGEPVVIDALTRWLRQPGRRLRLVGLRFEGMQGSQPRFATWRRLWTHAIEAVTPLEVEPSDMPTLLLVAQPPLALELIDRERYRGRHCRDVRDVRLAMERVAALLQRSEPAWPANALGL